MGSRARNSSTGWGGEETSGSWGSLASQLSLTTELQAKSQKTRSTAGVPAALSRWQALEHSVNDPRKNGLFLHSRRDTESLTLPKSRAEVGFQKSPWKDGWVSVDRLAIIFSVLVFFNSHTQDPGLWEFGAFPTERPKKIGEP